MLVVAGDHSLAPPQRRLIQSFCRSFSGALLGGVIPVGLQRASLFIWDWPSRQVAGALWSCQGEGTSFPGEGTPVPLTFTGAFCWEASQAQVNMGTILTWDSTHPDPSASCRDVTEERDTINRQHSNTGKVIKLIKYNLQCHFYEIFSLTTLSTLCTQNILLFYNIKSKMLH